MMDALQQYIAMTFSPGQQELANHVRLLIARREPDMFERMVIDDDHSFLEASLFASLTGNNDSDLLPQQLWGIIASDARPVTVTAASDCHGRIYLPRAGSLYSQKPNTLGKLTQLDDSVFQFRDTYDEEILHLRPEARIGAPSLRVDSQIPELWWRFLEQPSQLTADDQLDRPVILIALQQALAFIEKHDPELFLWIIESTQFIGLFRAPGPNSFAGLSTHGAVFLNLSVDADLIFFLDDLSHQCGHVIFNAMTHDVAIYLKVSREELLAKHTLKKDDTRSVYAAFHGLFTYSLILRTLDCYLTYGDYDNRQRCHALGRIAFYLSKFAQDLQTLDNPALFTTTGWQLMNSFQQAFTNSWHRYGSCCVDVCLDNQPYAFSWQHFQAANAHSRELAG